MEEATAGLAAPDEARVKALMDSEDWDPDTYDAAMAAAFGEDYYEVLCRQKVQALFSALSYQTGTPSHTMPPWPPLWRDLLRGAQPPIPYKSVPTALLTFGDHYEVCHRFLLSPDCLRFPAASS